MIIDSTFRLRDQIIPQYGIEVVKNEPMLFNCDLEHAQKLGGPITNAVLDALPPDWYNVPLVIDSRVHMLMPGWYPCIPGWHHDDVPRTRSDFQPNYGPDQNRSHHLVCLVNGDICPTAMAVGSAVFEEPPVGDVIYKTWHRDVERKLKDGELKKISMMSNRIYEIDDRTWHTGTRAIENGWRFFIRVSRYFSPSGKAIRRGNHRTNELRRQVQVYLENPNDGW